MTTASLLHSGDEDIKEIQQIIIFNEAANLAKRVVGATNNLTMMAKRKQLERSDSR